MSRPIAMSARFYFPVSQNRRNSVWSLYRIDPDGRNRVRLTDGPHDDTEPRCPPRPAPRRPRHPRRGSVRGRRGRGPGAPDRLAGRGVLAGAALGGRRPGAGLPLRPGAVPEDRRPLPKVEDMADGWDPPQPCPNAPRKVLLGRVAGESTFGHFTVYRSVDTRTGAVANAGAGRFLALAPDQMCYATVVRRQGAHYTKGPVWVQPLEIGRLGGGDTTPVTPGLVYVVGADWRGGARR